jgi:hypothetical protein
VPYIAQAIENTPYKIDPKQAPDSKFTTILDLITADHPAITNVLIDQSKIEKVILIDRLAEARSVMFQSHEPPANVRECYTLEGAKLFVK